MYRAVLDTCVLVPSLQRDFLLQLATEGTFAPVWGTGIMTELDYALARLFERRGISDSEQRRRHLLQQMERAFPGSEVHAPKGGSYQYDLADPDDEHVAHAALISKADAIVTDDGRAGFRTARVLVDAGIDTVAPPQFAARIVAAHPESGLRALLEMSARRRKPAQGPDEILVNLAARYGMGEVTSILGPLVGSTDR